MRRFGFFVLIISVFSCSEIKKSVPFSSVTIEMIYEDSLSIRAIELMGNSIAFAANKGTFGTVDLASGKVRSKVEQYRSVVPEFRSIAANATDFFMLSVGNPALLYKTGEDDKMDLVYIEEDETVFYDAMAFWNNREGIAIGDSMGGCLSIIITRDGGHHWSKLSCDDLPAAHEGEGAFAASNTNIKIVGDKTWIATTSGRIHFSGDKGKTWEVFQTPIINTEPTQGIYSVDFWNEDLGVVIGGDYTKPENNTSNKAITKDGGRTWDLISDGQNPNYKSCVQFVPNSGGNEIVAIGFTGISYSSDMGSTWKQLSDEPFYAIRFLNRPVAYAAGKNRISKLTFR